MILDSRPLKSVSSLGFREGKKWGAPPFPQMKNFFGLLKTQKTAKTAPKAPCSQKKGYKLRPARREAPCSQPAEIADLFLVKNYD